MVGLDDFSLSSLNDSTVLGKDSHKNMQTWAPRSSSQRKAEGFSPLNTATFVRMDLSTLLQVDVQIPVGLSWCKPSGPMNL